jgi:hypothetical protein
VAVSILAGLAQIIGHAWFFLAHDGGARDMAVLGGEFAVAGVGFRYLYWPDLRYTGRHRPAKRSTNLSVTDQPTIEGVTL